VSIKAHVEEGFGVGKVHRGNQHLRVMVEQYRLGGEVSDSQCEMKVDDDDNQWYNNYDCQEYDAFQIQLLHLLLFGGT
jgi:hypothetical protein